MPRRIAFLIASGLLLTASGCGTLLNLDGMDTVIFGAHPPEEVQKHLRLPYPYGGVGNDITWMKRAEQPIDVVGPLIDMPLSFTADTLTLPWTIYRATHTEVSGSMPTNPSSESARSFK